MPVQSQPGVRFVASMSSWGGSVGCIEAHPGGDSAPGARYAFDTQTLKNHDSTGVWGSQARMLCSPNRLFPATRSCLRDRDLHAGQPKARGELFRRRGFGDQRVDVLSLIHISEPTRLLSTS